MQRAKRDGSLRTIYGTTKAVLRHVFSDAAREYRALALREVQEGERSPRGWHNQDIALGKIECELGSVLLSDLGRSEIEAFKAQRRASVKGATVNRDLACISVVLEHAIQLGWLAENATRLVSRYRENPNTMRWLRQNEARALLGACRDQYAPPHPHGIPRRRQAREDRWASPLP